MCLLGKVCKIALLKWVDVRNAITYVNFLMNVIAFTSIPSHTRECGYTLTRNYHNIYPHLFHFVPAVAQFLPALYSQFRHPYPHLTYSYPSVTGYSLVIGTVYCLIVTYIIFSSENQLVETSFFT